MNKIGTFEDFKHFAKDKVGVKDESMARGFITPYVLEESNLHLTTYDIFSRMLLERIVFLSGEVTHESMDTIVAQLLYLDSIDNRDINIYINSPGGDCYSGLELVSVMDFVKSDISTTVLGLAASMGAVILSAGEKGHRFALPHSRVMIHQPLGGAQGQATDILIEAEQIKILKNELCGILAENSGQPLDKVLADCERDHWMIASEAKEYGLIDNIIVKK